MSSKDLNLPRDMSNITQEVVSEMYAEVGSIRKCKDIHDFGQYRKLMVEKFDQKIKKLQSHSPILFDEACLTTGNSHKYKMAIGKGNMMRVALSYRNGTISKKLLEIICEENNWECKFDKQNGVLISPKIVKNE